MNRLMRWLVVVPTSVATACGGRACATREQDSRQTPPATVVNASVAPDISTPDDLKVVFQGLEALTTTIPRETFDVKAVMPQAGQTPAAILDWVRDNTSWVAYRGALRGPAGVLMDRVGNSLDRSLLLAEMLRQSGRTIRLAHAALSESRARDLLALMGPAQPAVPSQPRVSSAAQKELDLARIARAFQLDPDGLRKTIDEDAARRNTSLTELAQRIDGQLDMLVDATAGAIRPTDDGPAVVAAAADHWWVQYLEGARWIDLDAALPKHSDGVSFEADRTLAIDKPAGQIPVPEDLAHQVTIRVVVGQLAGGRLTRKVALEHEFRPAEAFDAPIVLQHVPLDWPASTTFVQAGNPAAALRDAALKQKEWLPVLAIGSRTVRQSAFTETGELIDPPGKSSRPGNAVGSAFSGGFDALGGGDDPGGGGQLAAEWIEYDIRVPGEPRRVVRRDVFDLAAPFTPAARLRRALSLLGRVEILPVVSRLSRPYVHARRTEAVLRNREALSSVLARITAGDLAGALEPAAKLLPSADPLLALALARFDSSSVASDVYVNAPNILTYQRQPVDDGSGGLAIREGIDIVANSVGVRPTSRLLPFYVRLLQGVTDTNAEALIMGGAPLGNAAMLVGSTTARDRWILLRGAGEAVPSDVRWSPEFRRRVSQSLESGHMVIAPRQAEGPAGSAFWAVNPLTGDTVGIGYLGWGQATTEYLMVVGLFGVAAFLGVCAAVVARNERRNRNGPVFLDCLGAFAAGPLGWAVDYALASPSLPPPSVAELPYSRMCGAKALCR